MEKKKNKAGRPKSVGEKLEKLFPCRLTINEYNKAINEAQRVNIKPSELARQYIVKGYVSNLFSEEEQTEKRQLIGIRNNLNQLAKLAHTEGFVRQLKAIDALIIEIDEILKRYRYVSKSHKSR
jgi:hypothetical protein